MSINKYNAETGELVTLASGQRVWIGTKAQHDAAVAAHTMPNNCLVSILDDSEDAQASQVSYDNTDTGLTADNVQDAIDEMNRNNLGTRVNINNIYTSSNKFVCPSDGYVCIEFSGVQQNFVVCVAVYGADEKLALNFGVYTNASTYASYQGKSLFVKKGMKVYTLTTVPANAAVVFMPLTD